jgi:sigma-54 specific flagellar transcriptional regulator A
VVATNLNLMVEVEAGRFRRDLYYRLMVCPLELAPLRERSGDVAELFNHFWRARGETRPVAEGVYHCLASYPWPGNVRELENLVERLSVCSEGSSIGVTDLPMNVRLASAPSVALRPTLPVLNFAPESGAPQPVPAPILTQSSLTVNPVTRAPLELTSGAIFLTPAPHSSLDLRFPVNLPTLLRELEVKYIDAALDCSQGNKKAAADLLGLQRTTLVEKLKRRDRDSMVP